MLRPPPAARAAGLDPQLAAVLTVQHRTKLGGMEKLALAAARKLHDTGLAPLDCHPLPMREVIEVAGPPALRIYRPFAEGAATSADLGEDAVRGRRHREPEAAASAPQSKTANALQREVGALGSARDTEQGPPPDDRAARDAGSPYPRGLVLYFHGGGGVMGSRDTHDGWCRFLAHHAQVQVVSVEYRLAPEHPHPAAIEDALAAWRWVVDHAARLGATRLAVGGDSFGGYLAAMIDQATSRPEVHPAELPGAGGLPPPELQVLIYPLVDLTLSSPSVEAFGEGYLLTAELMRWFRTHYLGERDSAALRRGASPLLVDRLPRATSALMTIGGFDPLYDETCAYARRLSEEAGAEVELLEHDDLIHGFVVMTGAIERARAAGLQLCQRLRARLG